MKKMIPIGHEDFKGIIENNLYYVDKTLMLRDMIDGSVKVSLFTRPRRFGKTLNLSMIRRFFEDERTPNGTKIDNGHLFDGLDIMKTGEKYLAMQQQYPVIKLSLKSAKQPEVKEWYDGYQFGSREIYNPWSILNYVDEIIHSDTEFPKAYWANTSSNSIVRELIEGADDLTKNEMEKLINGETIEKPIHEDITYEDIRKSMDNLWNFLFFTGYLKKLGERKEGKKIYMKMAVPNMEIGSIYENIILEWFDEKVKNTDRNNLYAAVAGGDGETMENRITDLLQQSISFYDYAESYYHGFLLGVLSGMEGYIAVSNRESGDGRPDIILKTGRIRKGTAIILELKIADSIPEMEEGCRKALAQIQEKHYEKALLDEGYERILQYGICFCKKECMVKQGEILYSMI